jgi:hypothetical protein
MTPLAQARMMFPNMPDDIFTEFLQPLIVEDIGWPFNTPTDSLVGTDWYRILYPLTLEALCYFKWFRKVFTITENILYEGSVTDIKLIIRNKAEDIWASIGRDSAPCRNSLLWHEADIQKTGKFRAPVTIAYTPFGLKILDGNHRVAALFPLGLMEIVQVDAWIGCPPEMMT